MSAKQDLLHTDIDHLETSEWLEAIESIIRKDGPERAHFIIEQLVDKTRRSGGYLPYDATTAYINTIPVGHETALPGDREMERKIRAIIRWNAMAIVLRASKRGGDLGGHIASFSSAATLYDVGFNHFFRGADHPGGGDLLYLQGHSSPGFYARAFLEGRITEDQLDHFREEVDGNGLSSYPHPWLMPDFWQFPTVSMGLGPISAIYQARFLKYLHNRGIADTSDRKVWCFIGDGETDEPESLGAISLAGREKLDNLIFVINCNLQRLDGPVRGNGKIIQELEGAFRGSSWNVIKVIWGSYWDPLLAQDTKGLLRQRMEEAVDGEYQNYKAKGGAYTREHFFGKYPELKEMVAKMSDKDIWRLNRGGHDPQKVYAAYDQAVKHTGQPTVILAKSVKGYGMGDSGEAQNASHQQKKMDIDSVRQFRDRFNVPISDADIENIPLYHPGADSPEVKYMQERRKHLGGYLPKREDKAPALTAPPLSVFESVMKASGEREISTTMAFVRILSIILRNPELKELVVPIVADEARTFGMEGMFRQLGIYSSVGQLYEPVDSDQLMFYKEDIKGQILQEGITETGALASWLAAATSHSSNQQQMIPFFIYYSMFGFQRFGDLAWAAGDARARGFLIGGTSGRTTLNGEGLQHEDGHSQVLAGTNPNCITYDPTFAYELAVIIQDGMRRMYQELEDKFYYITVLNENYSHPAMPEGSEEGIRKGLYLFRAAGEGKHTVQLMGSGAILREVIAGASILEQEFNVTADIWSATSFNELRKDGFSAVRFNRLNSEKEPRLAWITQCLQGHEGPVIAATDYVRSFADQVRAFIPQRDYMVLGTDGFGRSDTRKRLRSFFEVDRYHVAYAALFALYRQGAFSQSELLAARDKLKIATGTADPWTI
ncbi:MAG: pyruvate dehydrogenase (acetyl-transferring), homodimeric type [Xanthomonadales bacterium]|nr:pyruvate dehydrogenase (acetyl-transferring), homodimeric type [Xanthomonadales bacterium]